MAGILSLFGDLAGVVVATARASACALSTWMARVRGTGSPSYWHRAHVVSLSRSVIRTGPVMPQATLRA